MLTFEVSLLIIINYREILPILKQLRIIVFQSGKAFLRVSLEVIERKVIQLSLAVQIAFKILIPLVLLQLRDFLSVEVHVILLLLELLDLKGLLFEFCLISGLLLGLQLLQVSLHYLLFLLCFSFLSLSGFRAINLL